MGGTAAIAWWTSNSSATVSLSVALAFCFWALYAAVTRLRVLSCRLFIPASMSALGVLVAVHFFLLSVSWYKDLTHSEVVLVVFTSMVGAAGLFLVVPGQITNSFRPSSLKKHGSNGASTDHVALHHSLLTVIDEYNVRKAEPKLEACLQTFCMNENSAIRAWYYFPIVSCLSFLGVPLLMIFVWGSISGAFVIVTLFAAYTGWRLADCAMLAYVGVKKMVLCNEANFAALYEAEAGTGGQPNGHSGPTGRPTWKEVVHFVILPNYKEEFDILKQAIRSIAMSGIAKDHIGIVLAMEDHEQEGRNKAHELERLFQDDFRHIFSTFHPVGLPGDMPGKSANTKWATDRLFDDFLPNKWINDRNVIVTVADADSNFHSEYFAALSYYFCHAGGADGEVPDRYLTIWQAPILHFKNYDHLPALVQLASFVPSLHELASLADPNATRVPYSTYSISAVLAKKVGGWDPDWISEDWHMALKCFFATGGRLRVTPIPLPVLNYAPVGDTWLQTIHARWRQACRHALGFSEMSFIGINFLHVWRALDSPWAKVVYAWRAYFWWLRLAMVHLTMALFIGMAPLTSYLVSSISYNHDVQDLHANGGLFLLYCVFQALSFLALCLFFSVSVLVHEAVQERIDCADVCAKRSSRPLRMAIVVIQSWVCFPAFLLMASLAEWIAAVKTTRGHTFDYDVAAKPKPLGDEEVKPNSVDAREVVAAAPA